MTGFWGPGVGGGLRPRKLQGESCPHVPFPRGPSNTWSSTFGLTTVPPALQLTRGWVQGAGWLGHPAGTGWSQAKPSPTPWGPPAPPHLPPPLASGTKGLPWVPLPWATSAGEALTAGRPAGTTGLALLLPWGTCHRGPHGQVPAT